ncbi:MAG: class I SAM-dependent methyltransferase [Alphaproteobacteria bacterium]|nr:class I SAM-dependent methyltransferase [Alphaproteobacteria bacterium]
MLDGIGYLIERLTGRKRRRILALTDAESRFGEIYRLNYWGNSESRSGFGSSLAATANLRAELPKIFERFSIGSVLDVPCGDFHWMKQIVAGSDVSYWGGDIVAPLVEKNQARYGSAKVRFSRIDITKDALPHSDLLICRHCLFHLSYREIASALRNYWNSGIPYLLVTSHLPANGEIVNTDIETGDFRVLDLHKAPFNFPQNARTRIRDYIPPDQPMELCLWHRDDIANAIGSLAI